MSLRVVLNPAANEDLQELYNWVRDRTGDPAVALRYVDHLRERCERLALVPEQGTRREEFGVGIRSIGVKRRATIFFRIADGEIEVLRILYGGRDVVRALRIRS